MKIHDKNPDNEEVIILIHPMLSSAKAIDHLMAQHLGDGYRYIMPDISGHGDARNDRYMSCAIEAQTLHSYLVSNGIKKIKFAFASSLGCQVLFHLLKYDDIEIDRLFFEAASFHLNSFVLCHLIKMTFLKKHRMAVADPKKSVEKMEKLYGPDLAETMSKRFIELDEASIVKMIYDCGYVYLHVLSRDMQKKCTFSYGSRDGTYKMARIYAKKMYPYAELKVWKGCGHCTMMTKHPLKYTNYIKSLLD